MQHHSLSGQWKFRQLNTKEWMPATVPGGVHTDLLALGKIPDPFVGDNEKQVQWIGESDWEYRRIFTVEPALAKESRQTLVCDGLDALAEASALSTPLSAEAIEAAGAEAIIPPRSNRNIQRKVDWHRYKARNLVERFFNRLKQFRRIATRYDKLANRFNAFLHLACAYIWLL